MCLEIGIRAAVILVAYRGNVHPIHNGEERLLGDFGNLPVVVEKVVRYHQSEHRIRIFYGQRIIILTIRFASAENPGISVSAGIAWAI